MDIKPTLRRAMYNALPEDVSVAVTVYQDGPQVGVMIFGLSRRDAAHCLIAAGSNMLDQLGQQELSSVSANDGAGP
jgi:hypothetical protein